MEVFKSIDFELICRTCLSIEANMNLIFDTEICNMINDCKFLQVDPNDGFPGKICGSCQELLTQSFNFKLQCEKSNLTLQQYSKEMETEILDNINEVGEDIWLESIDDENIINFNCTECNQSFANQTDLMVHQDWHFTKDREKSPSSTIHCKNKTVKTDKKKVGCRKCNVSFEKGKEYEKHCCKEDLPMNDTSAKVENVTPFLEKVSSCASFPCADCTQSFNTEYDLQLHVSTHSKSGELECSQCKKKFADKRALNRHIKIHMLHKPHVCKTCGKGFAELYALIKHTHKHTGIPRQKKHVCAECGQGFFEPFYLRVHERKHTGERPLICSACGKSFADPRSLKSHNMIHTGEKPYVCNVCGKSFRQNVNLTKHLRVHTGEKPYVCEECGKCFTQSCSLEKHSRIHSGIKPFACDKCPKRFTEKGTLIHHQRRHTGEKPFVCAQCGYSFASSSELKLHDRKHSGIKMNVCLECGKDFATPSNLMAHSRSHSGEKPFSCHVCQRSFTDKRSLRKHSKIHTKSVDDFTQNTLDPYVNSFCIDDSINVIDAETKISLTYC